MGKAYLMGHDAELFTVAEGKIVPVCGRVGGTKEKPLPLPDSKVGTTYQEDGVALELGMTPCLAQEFLGNASVCLREANSFAKSKGLELTQGSSHKFKVADLKPFPEAMILGCCPDQLASARGEKREPFAIESFNNQRFTGGHLHFSYPMGGTVTDPRNANNVPTWAIVDMLDAMALAYYRYHSLDFQTSRYSFYGLPGLYRDKPYGLEYRTPANSWLWHTDRETATFIEGCARVVQACNELSATKIHEYYSKIDMDVVRDLLNLTNYHGYPERLYNDPHGILNKIEEIRQDMFAALGELRE